MSHQAYQFLYDLLYSWFMVPPSIPVSLRSFILLDYGVINYVKIEFLSVDCRYLYLDSKYGIVSFAVLPVTYI